MGAGPDDRLFRQHKIAVNLSCRGVFTQIQAYLPVDLSLIFPVRIHDLDTDLSGSLCDFKIIDTRFKICSCRLLTRYDNLFRQRIIFPFHSVCLCIVCGKSDRRLCIDLYFRPLIQAEIIQIIAALFSFIFIQINILIIIVDADYIKVISRLRLI